MDPLWLSRIQYAATTIFHFLFVPVSISLALFIAIIETMYVAKGKEIYKKMAKFWGKLFLINFAVGVVTGILQEFQFGMNWSDYSRFVGDVFGAPLAVEALLAFFLESTFLGIWIFGWERLSKKVHALTIWLVFIGTLFSAFWILVANSFMQHPVGFGMQNGRAEMNDFLALITNGQVLVEFPHTIFGALMTGAALIAGISAWQMLKKRDGEAFGTMFKMAAAGLVITFLGVAFSGHFQAQYLVKTQPMKMAASEGQWGKSGDPAAWNLIAFIDPEKKENSWEIQIPGLLSYLSYSKFSGEVKGINELQTEYEQKYGPGNYIPPVRTTFWSFRIMIVAGSVSVLLGAYGMYLALRRKLDQAKPWYLRAVVWGIGLPFIANTAGWVMTEVGRQPWTVFGLMRTEDAVSPNVSAWEILLSTITFTAAYTVLGIVLVYLFVKTIKKGLHPEVPAEQQVRDPFHLEEVYHAAK
ncbi:cytochrome ubiquinol oxidase subunit I [Paenibacillus sp. JX-17]|uniref:Cytochrome ubiquinol oxidase subunit I n=1 Tax=Paenibacillus lacisoli TaxID=3064525 RepID=A0ABT9CAT4_9BACL|nr:cytochrome ubiquinol oxidase subunit I [Paenibacillus sp. JX-17]MDO7906381.1 cytochrome ubiquinol oxidase subunit I [Paenibacillus sp. JX-17]